MKNIILKKKSALSQRPALKKKLGEFPMAIGVPICPHAMAMAPPRMTAAHELSSDSKCVDGAPSQKIHQEKPETT